jgi:hypothetical protein
MLDVEKFLVALRSNKDVDGKLKPIHLADTVQEEIKIIQAAVESSRRKWVGLTDEEVSYCRYAATFCDELDTAYMAELIEKDLKEKNYG